jgi:hypothetical protein
MLQLHTLTLDLLLRIEKLEDGLPEKLNVKNVEYVTENINISKSNVDCEICVNQFSKLFNDINIEPIIKKQEDFMTYIKSINKYIIGTVYDDYRVESNQIENIFFERIDKGYYKFDLKLFFNNKPYIFITLWNNDKRIIYNIQDCAQEINIFCLQIYDIYGDNTDSRFQFLFTGE